MVRIGCAIEGWKYLDISAYFQITWALVLMQTYSFQIGLALSHLCSLDLQNGLQRQCISSKVLVFAIDRLRLLLYVSENVMERIILPRAVVPNL
jgi:hypothetical protein